jgi:NAD(P)-dependent dehydrogenase (short-subunit alcohol dehydrogenase family)
MPYQSIFRPDLFKDQVMIVTGGGTGIGRAIAHELASLGATVALGSRDASKPENVKAEIEAAGGKAIAGPCNIRDRDSVAAFVKLVLEQAGKIDGLVNNGGGQFVTPAHMISPKGWNAVIDTNLTGTWNMTQAVMLEWMQEHGGAIVNITMENRRGYPGMAHSGAARAGVENLTKSLAVEWSRFGIRLNCIAPGTIDSSGLKHYPPEIQAELSNYARSVPAKRLGSESEIASLTTFLLSPGANYMTGETIWVDGGYSLWQLYYPLEDHGRWPEAYDGYADEVEE